MKAMVRPRGHFAVPNPAEFKEALYTRALTFLLRMPAVSAQSFVEVLHCRHSEAKELIARLDREGKLGEPDTRGRRKVIA